jgi:hypothetical protein
MNVPQSETLTYLGSNYKVSLSREDKEQNLFYALDLLALQPVLIDLNPELAILFEQLLTSFEMNGTRVARDLLENNLEIWKTASTEGKQRMI